MHTDIRYIIHYFNLQYAGYKESSEFTRFHLGESIVSLYHRTSDNAWSLFYLKFNVPTVCYDFIDILDHI